MLVFYTMGNPDSHVSVILSLLPMFSPILMFMRISMQTPPAVQVIASIVISVFSIWGMIWLVARIFRVGILMYGKRPNVPELLKWIRYG
jgi:ABC-2 type transport system permease protein